MTEQERLLNREQLQYAHRFAAQQFAQEIRAFWARVTALLMVNSLLVAGFTLLHGSKNPNDTLLLTIAASGIAIQSLWPLFAVHSYTIFPYWGNLMRAVERYPFVRDRADVEMRVQKIWTRYGDDRRWSLGVEQESDESDNEALCRFATWVARLVDALHPGAFATILFFFIFLAIWLVAAIMAKPDMGSLVAKSLGSAVGFMAILCLIAYLYTKKRTKNETIQAVR